MKNRCNRRMGFPAAMAHRISKERHPECMEVVMVCTALTYQTRDHYFGRTLDISSGYQEAVTVVPRHFPLAFRQMGTLGRHYAMVGTAYPAGGYPLYYDAVRLSGGDGA